MAIAAEVAGELFEVAGLAGEVELAADDAAELGDHRLRPVGASSGSISASWARPARMSRSTSMRRWMPACCTFTTTSVAGIGPTGESRAVDLADRCRGERRRVEVDEERVERGVEFGFDRLADGVGVVGGHVGLQLLQFVGERHADLVGPRAEDLAELDERGPELFDRQADAGLAAEVGERFAVAVLEDALHDGQVEAADPAGEAVLAEDREDLAPAIGVAIDLRDGGDFHASGAATMLRLSADGFQGFLGETGETGVGALGGRARGRGRRLGGGTDFAQCPGGPLADRQIGVALEHLHQRRDGRGGACRRRGPGA